MANDPTLSLCMIVRDEAANLPRSLGPVCRFFDEAVVVDTGSTDGTPETARSYGARVIQIDWPDDFASARNTSIQAASGDWIMWLDGDNHVSPEDVHRLRSFLDKDFRSVLWCTEVVVPEGERLIQKRIFPRQPQVYFEGRVHEQLIHPPEYRSVLTPVEILHWGYADKASAREKGQRNLRLLGTMVEDQPTDFYLCYQMGRTLFNLRRFEEALTWLDRALAATGASESNLGLYRHAHILKAQACDRLGRFNESEQMLGDLVQAAPGYGLGHYTFGRMKYTQGKYKEAAERFRYFLDLEASEPAAGLNPGQLRFTAALLLGRALEKNGRDPEAEKAFHLAASMAPDHPEPKLALADLALRAGRNDEARNHLAECFSVSPGNRKATDLARRIEARA